MKRKRNRQFHIDNALVSGSTWLPLISESERERERSLLTDRQTDGQRRGVDGCGGANG